MILKRLIAISVVFALVAGTAFAVDLGGEVIGTIGILNGSNAKDGDGKTVKPTSYGLFDRLRFEGSGANDADTFGGWIRFETPWYTDDLGFEGLAWWKPIDQFKLSIGGNSDGIYAKEGQTAWMFYQRATDTGVSDRGDSSWGDNGRYGFDGGSNLITRNAFYGGFGSYGLLLDIKPVDVLGINIAVPFISETGKPWAAGEPKNILKKIEAQIDLNLDFGNIALTYRGGLGLTEGAAATGKEFYLVSTNTGTPTAPNWGDPAWTGTKPTDAALEAGTSVIFDTKATGTAKVDDAFDPGTIFAYFGLTSIENLGIDFGIGFPLPLKQKVGDVTWTYISPLAVGLGVQYSAGDFGIKARLTTSFAGSTKTDIDGDKPEKTPLQLTFDVLPSYRVTDNLKIFLSAGLGIVGSYVDPDGNKADNSSQLGIHVSPYVWVGEEWGPSFWAGFQLQSVKIYDRDASVTWSIPIAMGVSF